MNVLILSANRHAYPFPVMPYGACLVAEATERAGHDVSLLDLMFEGDPLRALEQRLREKDFGVVGVSVRNVDNNDMNNPAFFIEGLLPLLKTLGAKSGARIVLGGAAIGVMPQEIMRATGVSLAVLGDGDIVFPELLERLSSGSPFKGMPGVACLEHDIFSQCPSSFPASRTRSACPDFGRWLDLRTYGRSLSMLPLQTKLGCSFSCIYCTYGRIEGREYRFFDLDEVVDSIERLVSAGTRSIEFVDNVFNAPYGHAAALCESLIASEIETSLYSLELNPLFVDDALISLMERAGFKGIGITAESASDSVLAGLGKGYCSGAVYHAAEVMGRHNLPCLWIFLLGGPGESPKTVAETLRFAEECIRPGDTAFFNVGIRIYPGTELETVARRQGVLMRPPGEMLPPVFYLSPDLEPAEMTRLLKRSMASNMNFIDSGSLAFPFLPIIHRMGHRLGIRSPLWRYTRHIRRGLRLAGFDV